MSQIQVVETSTLLLSSDPHPASGSCENFSRRSEYRFFNLPNLFHFEPTTSHISVRVRSCSILHSFYVLNDSNNEFVISDSEDVTHLVTLPIGNFTSTEFINVLLPLFRDVVGDATATIELSNSTGCLTFTASSFFSFIVEGSTAGPILGLDDEDDMHAELTEGWNREIVLTTPLNLSGPSSIQIRTPNLDFASCYDVQTQSSSILETVLVSSPPFGVILFDSGAGNSGMVLRNRHPIHHLELELVANGVQLDFNNLKNCWTICLEIQKFHQVTPIPTSYKPLLGEKGEIETKEKNM